MGSNSKMVTYKYEDALVESLDSERLKRIGRYKKKVLSKARYWCFRIQNEINGGSKANPPKGFKSFIESLPGFTSWDTFAIKWDIVGSNPFMIVHRLISVWTEWEHVMDRVAIPIDATEEEVQRRQEILTKQYRG